MAPACALGLALTATASAATNLSAYWPLNEPTGTLIHDTSGNANTGVASGGVTHIAGRFENALHFDGVDGQVLVDRSPSLEPAHITVESWVRASASPGQFRYVVAHAANQCLVPSYGLYTGTGGGLSFVISGGLETNFTTSPSVGAGIWNGAWHHVAGTFDGATVRLYVDGAQVGTGTPATQPIAYGLPTSNTTLLGAFGGGPCKPGDGQLNFAGDLDETHVWARALAPDEVAAGAAMGAPGTAKLGQQIEAGQAIAHSLYFSTGRNIKVSLESATGTERISSIRIDQFFPLATGFGCGGGLLFSPCDITLTNGGRTATLTVTRNAGSQRDVGLEVHLASGRELEVYVNT